MHSVDEDRFLAIGPVARGILCVVFVERAEDVIRILGARRAARREEELFLRSLKGKRP